MTLSGPLVGRGLLQAVIASGLGLGCISGAGAGWGRELSTNTGDYTILNWQSEQGLPQISVTSIAQTPDGYLWVGTFNGLVRFDGVRFTVFDEGNTPTLGSSKIMQLQVDEQGALWIVTLAGGVVRMAAGQFTLALKQDAPLLLGEGEFSESPNRRLLLGDRTNRWWQIENGRLIPLASTDRSRARDEPRFLFENSGVTWLLQQGNLTRGSKKTPIPLPASEGSKSNRIELAITSAAASQSGGYWLATETGVYRLRQGKLATWVAPLPLGIEQPMSLKEDGRGNLWAGKWGAGVYRLGPDGSWQKFGAGTGLADNFVNCLFRDREGSLWVGTFQGGLHRFRPLVFQSYDTLGASNNVVMSVTQDRQGRIWLAVNGGGLHTWADGQLIPVTEPARLRSYPLTYSVLADHQDALWVGLYGMKILRWHADTVTPYDLEDGSGQPMTPNALFEDHNGTVWLGCTHGLISYESGRFTRYTCREGLSCDTVVALAEDRRGSLYAGTDGGGLNCLRQGRFTCFTERDGLADNHVSSLLYVQKDETLWIGTVNGGLSRFKHGRFANFTIGDGLPSNTIGSLIEDDQDNLWLGSNRGIIRVRRQGLNAYADGDRRPVDWRVFGLSDGLTTVGCTGGGQPASWKAHDGKLWFATIKGAAVVDTNRVPSNPYPPPVVIEEVVLEGLAVSGAQTEDPRWQSRSRDQKPKASGTASSALPSLITVAPRTHRIELYFTGLSLVASEKVRFRHRLDPLDGDWVEDGTRRFADYTRIPPGRYLFRVIACNNDGVWNATGASLGLVVLPPWWSTWWFKLLAAVAVGGTFFGWHELRLHRVRRERTLQESFARQLLSSQENERRRIAGDLHDGLGQNLVLIRNRAELGLRQLRPAPAMAEQLQEISLAAAQSLEEVRATAHALRPYELERLGLTQAIQDAAQKVAETSGVKFSCDLERIDGVLAPEAEIALFRILQEGISNVLRHAQASHRAETRSGRHALDHPGRWSWVRFHRRGNQAGSKRGVWPHEYCGAD